MLLFRTYYLYIIMKKKFHLLVLFIFLSVRLYSIEDFYCKKDTHLYFFGSVPKNVHFICLDNSMDDSILEEWEEYCSKYKYNLYLWDQNAIKRDRFLFSLSRYNLINLNIKEKSFWVAHNIILYEILYRYGGYYFHKDVRPPKIGYVSVDLRDVFPKYGFTAVQQVDINIRHRATEYYYGNYFFSCPPRHPVSYKCYRNLIKSISGIYQEKFLGAKMPSFLKSKWFFNTQFFGPINTFRIEYLQKYDML